MKIIESLIVDAEKNSRLRRDIHSHPELCFEEKRTGDLVAEFLEENGIEVHRGVGGTGIVGVIKKGNSSRGIALRADMDALPIQEQNQFSHASIYPGKMHACGHDGHTATLLSAAKVLAHEADFDGRVVLIFQPAEEIASGAKAMIEDGLFERFPVDAIFGFHNRPGMPVGHMAVRPGPCYASTIDFHITLKGKGAHASMPHLGNDPIVAGCQLVQSFQTIITRNKRPIDAGVLSVTMFHAGEATNAIPETCTIRGTARAFAPEVLQLIKKRLESISKNTAQTFDLECDLEWKKYCPSVVNHPEEAEFLRKLMINELGAEKVSEGDLTLSAEDFSFFLEKKPGAYFLIGNGLISGDHRDVGHGLGPCLLHNHSYDFNDELIPLGATFWVRLVERWLTTGDR